eukprot:g748.t1
MPGRGPRPRRGETNKSDSSDEGSAPPSEPPPESKRSSRRPRRRRASDSDSGSDGRDKSMSRSGAKSGWGVDSKKSPMSEARKASKRGRRSARQRGRKMDDKHFGTGGSDSDDLIPVIPVLEEEEEEAELTTVAEAPKIRTLRVQSMIELDQQIRHTLPSGSSTGIDLGLLTKVLATQKATIEPDNEWVFEQLLQEVATELTAEEEAMEAFLKEEAEAGRQIKGAKGKSYTPSLRVTIKGKSKDKDKDGGGGDGDDVNSESKVVDAKVSEDTRSDLSNLNSNSVSREMRKGRRRRRREDDIGK